MEGKKKKKKNQGRSGFSNCWKFLERAGHYNVFFPCEKCIYFTHLGFFQKMKADKKYYSSNIRVLQRRQNRGWRDVFHFTERALQSDRDAALVLLRRENADACFNLDI